jgi:hypothetical protein
LVEEGVPVVMSGFVATLAVGFVGIAGTIAGVVVERFLRRYGKLRSEVRGWRVNFQAPDGQGSFTFDGPYEGIPPDRPGYAQCRFRVSFYNEKDVDTGLRDVYVLFSWPGGVTEEIPPVSLANQLSVEEIPVLNLPPRRWVWWDMQANISNEEGKRVSELERVVLRGYFPGGKLFEQVVVVK